MENAHVSRGLGFGGGGTQSHGKPAAEVRLHVELVHLVEVLRVKPVPFPGLICDSAKKYRAILVGHQAEACPGLGRHACFLDLFPLQ